MKKNLYFATYYQRRNPIKDALLNFFLGISSYPRLLIEVFIRRDMGSRYFNLFPVTVLTLFLLVAPFLLPYNYGNGIGETITGSWGWYLFTAAFIGFSYKRHQESKRKTGQHDFTRFSQSAGKLLPFVRDLKFGETKPSIRTLEVLIEPALAAIFAVLLIVVKQEPIGLLLLLSAIVYSLSYVAAYYRGDDFILDKIDEMLCNQDMSDAFLRDEIETPSGFRFYGDKPSSQELREEIYDSMFEETDEFSEVK